MNDLYSQANRRGVSTEFHDAHGRHRIVPPETLQTVLEALPPSRPRNLLPGTIILRDDRDRHIALRPDCEGLTWVITHEQRHVAAGSSDTRIELPPLHQGIYRFALIDQHGRVVDNVPLLVVPSRAYAAPADRVWLITVQLYGVRSQRNWGIGDFSDLAALMEMVSGWGCAGVGLNPLHALFDDRPADCSPYAPNSRLFLNALYIDVEEVPEFDPAWADHAAITRARASPLVDYVLVADLKLRALKRCFESFCAHAPMARRAAFDEFRLDRGDPLRRFAIFEVLRRRFPGPWWEWPEGCRAPDENKIAGHLRSGDRAEIEFVEYLQWCADSQLKRCLDVARSCAMSVGLYLDIAVGVQPDGFDAWNEQHAISPRLSVGAPPDILNTAGQDWGLAGFTADGLEAKNFEPFRAMLVASMRYAGAIRIDHILGLNRLYVVPVGSTPREGTFVAMPLQAMLAVLALESRARRCIVIGEDLGTVPDGFRAQLADWGVLSYKVMLFERGHDGAFLAADDYAADALVTFNTHDLASFAGWRTGHDLATKRALGLDPGESDEQRMRAQHALDERLREEGIGKSDFLAVVEFLARTPTKLLALALEDLLGVVDQPNVPGTVSEHPNWRRRLPVTVEQLPHHFKIAELRQATRERGS